MRSIVIGVIIAAAFQRCSRFTSSKNQYGEATVHIRLKAMKGLQYSLDRFSVKPGANVEITLINTGEMEHNLVFTQPNKRAQIVKLALKLGSRGPELHYVPKSDDVLWHISVLKPGDSQTISFKAPDEEGIYPYVCTYPGHGMTMYGAMYVTNKDLTPLNEDTNMHQQEEVRQGARQSHPYKIKPPYLMRIFMPDCGPAAIAVSLSDSLSYCWDAGSCKLRYVWLGGFLAHEDLWQRKGMEVAHINGTIFYKDKSEYPFRLGNKNRIPQVSFKGYRLINHYPEFHYQWDGVDVYELIKPDTAGSGIVRSFRIPKLTTPLWFVNVDSGRAAVSSPSGSWQKNALQLSTDEAKQFTIEVTNK